MRLSTLVGLTVYSPSGEEIGYTSAVFCNRASVAGYRCADGDENEFYVRSQGAELTGRGLVAHEKRKVPPAGVPAPLSRPVFDGRGRYLGRVEDMIEGEGLLVRGKIGMFFPLSACAVGEAVIVRAKRANGQKTAQRPLKNGTETPLIPFDLLGRRVKKTVAGEEEEIACAGDTVTPETLKKARESNKLLALYANTLTD